MLASVFAGCFFKLGGEKFKLWPNYAQVDGENQTEGAGLCRWAFCTPRLQGSLLLEGRRRGPWMPICYYVNPPLWRGCYHPLCWYILRKPTAWSFWIFIPKYHPHNWTSGLELPTPVYIHSLSFSVLFSVLLSPENNTTNTFLCLKNGPLGPVATITVPSVLIEGTWRAKCCFMNPLSHLLQA